jgi:hypothetical protein
MASSALFLHSQQPLAAKQVGRHSLNERFRKSFHVCLNVGFGGTAPLRRLFVSTPTLSVYSNLTPLMGPVMLVVMSMAQSQQQQTNH